MKNHNSDFDSQSRYYVEYYPLNSVPKTMFLIEAECLETPGDGVNKPKSSVKGVMFGLSILITLIMGSTWQLYRSLRVTPINPRVTQSQKLSSKVPSQSKYNLSILSVTLKNANLVAINE